MKLLALISPGLEDVSQQEFKELDVSSVIKNPQVLEFKVKKIEEALKLIYKLQSVRRILIYLGKYNTLEKINFDTIDFSWADFFSSSLSFKVDVEGIRGQENRLSISKAIAEKIFFKLGTQKIVPKIDVRKPDMLFTIFFNGKHYFMGIDLCGSELNSRSFRVFPHQASFKGDLAYFFVRKSEFQPGNKLLIGFAKDGALTIEAAFYSRKLPVQNKNRKDFSFFKFPCCNNLNVDTFLPNLKLTDGFQIVSVDDNQQNIIATRKNAQLAGVKGCLLIQKCYVDELDVKFSPIEFDHLIFQVTAKDEDKLNEICHQADYIIKKQGKVLLIGRKNWEPVLPASFILIEQNDIQRGESIYRFWLWKKK